MKRWDDKRLENVTVEHKDQSMNGTALTTLMECLEAISKELSDNLAAPLPGQKKGTCDNGNTGENQEPKGFC